MSLTLFFFLSSVYIFLEMVAFYRLLNNKLIYRFSHRTLIPTYIALFLLRISTQYAISSFPDLPLKIPSMLLFFALLLLIYKDALYIKILWIIVACFALLVCELLTVPIMMIFTGTNLVGIIYNSLSQFIATVLSRVLLFAVIEFLIGTKKRVLNVFLKDFFLIILIDVVYAFVFTGLFYFDSIYITTNAAIALSFFVMIIISLLSLYLLRKIIRQSDEIMTTNLKLQQIEMEHKQNQDMAIVVEDLRALRHDMNNHMGILQGLLSARAYDEANDYLATITKELTVANSFTFTENKVLSVLLNNKSSKARQLNITLDTEILTSTTPFSDRDLCAVIGNILENAIEASSNHNKPYIYFSMHTQKNGADKQLLIQCDNTYSVAPIFENGNLITTKEDKAYHGIGTKTIRSIVESYNGTVEFTADELFHVTISIPV